MEMSTSMSFFGRLSRREKQLATPKRKGAIESVVHSVIDINFQCVKKGQGSARQLFFCLDRHSEEERWVAA